jgi:NAD(P)-dependent dehydrogenase (short-subunit alcohol dehydrogenase family)
MGNVSGATTENVNTDVFDKTFAVNTRGTMLVLRGVTKVMAGQEPGTLYSPRHNSTRSLGRGSIVVLASVSAYFAGAGMMPYSSSKHAVIGITKTAGILSGNFHIQSDD